MKREGGRGGKWRGGSGYPEWRQNMQVEEEQGPGRATDREWRRPGLSHFRENLPDKKPRT